MISNINKELFRYIGYQYIAEKLRDNPNYINNLLNGIYFNSDDIMRLELEKRKSQAFCQKSWYHGDLFKRIYGPVKTLIAEKTLKDLIARSGGIQGLYLIFEQSIKKELEFNSLNFKNLLENNFNALIYFYQIYHGRDGILEKIKDDAFGKILETNAVLPSPRVGLLVSQQAIDIFKDVIKNKEQLIRQKFKNISNIEVIPFLYEYDNSKNLTNKIIITFYAEERDFEKYGKDSNLKEWGQPFSFGREYDIDENILLNDNIVLLLSPAELGYNIDNCKFDEYNCQNFSVSKSGRTEWWDIIKIKPLIDCNVNVEFNINNNLKLPTEVKNNLIKKIREMPTDDYKPLENAYLKIKNR